jgi:hypothetical protein
MIAAHLSWHFEAMDQFAGSQREHISTIVSTKLKLSKIAPGYPP